METENKYQELLIKYEETLRKYETKNNLPSWFIKSFKTALSRNITIEDWNRLNDFLANAVSDVTTTTEENQNLLELYKILKSMLDEVKNDIIDLNNSVTGLNEALETKVPKVENPSILYGTDNTGRNSVVMYTRDLFPNTVLCRDENGRAKINLPVEDNDITNVAYLKGYVTNRLRAYYSKDETNETFYNRQEVDDLIKTLSGLEFITVDTLPPIETAKKAIYLLRNSGSTPNIYDEYIPVSNGWEKLGTTDIDLSNYVKQYVQFNNENVQIEHLINNRSDGGSLDLDTNILYKNNNELYNTSITLTGDTFALHRSALTLYRRCTMFVAGSIYLQNIPTSDTSNGFSEITLTQNSIMLTCGNKGMTTSDMKNRIEIHAMPGAVYINDSRVLTLLDLNFEDTELNEIIEGAWA